MGHPRTTPKVLEALTHRRGRDVGIGELQTATGLDDAQIRSAMRSLIEREAQPITVVQRGAMWRLEDVVTVSGRPVGRKPLDTMFEKVGQTQGGDPIVRGDQTETLYKLTAL